MGCFNMADRSDFKFEIINELGIISEGSRGWKKELNRGWGTKV